MEAAYYSVNHSCVRVPEAGEFVRNGSLFASQFWKCRSSAGFSSALARTSQWQEHMRRDHTVHRLALTGKQIKCKTYRYIRIRKTGLQWLLAEAGVQQGCLHAGGLRTQLKAWSSLQSPEQVRSRRLNGLPWKPRYNVQGEDEEQSSSQETEAAFLSLFIPFGLRPYWLAPLAARLGLLSSVNALRHTQNCTDPVGLDVSYSG